MASVLAAYIYGANQNSWVQGKSMAFATNQIVIEAISPAANYGGVDCNSQIQLLPTAPSVIQPVYYTPTLIGDLVTSANTADS